MHQDREWVFEKDGTVGFQLDDSGIITHLSQGELNGLNNEANSDKVAVGRYESQWMGLIFPQPVDIIGHYITGRYSSGWAWRHLQTSVDTTNGMDGNWVTRNSNYALSNAAPVPNHRTNIVSVAWNGIKSVRHGMSSDGYDSGAWKTFHLYGTISNYAGIDTLRFWHPTLDEPLDDNTVADAIHLDWGDVTRGTTADRTFRVKNNSATLTANTITVSTSTLYNTTPTLESQITYDYNGSGFNPTATIPSLAPGAISTVVTVRKATDIGATLGQWSMQTRAEATSWS